MIENGGSKKKKRRFESISSSSSSSSSTDDNDGKTMKIMKYILCVYWCVGGKRARIEAAVRVILEVLN